ncbi:ABC transporter permease [Halocatena salina]|uniref:ABC transporter permease n=1 Tax=Halocatena salina TaxID=2934340 RepID=A0A8U0A364_9EURY|nr:ABC transporter permease [Halocatena salina]UPM43621.1 ABC transporter permease [Halocatena salina]
MSETATTELPFRERLRENPRPALLWVGVLGVLLALEIGAITSVAITVMSGLAGAVASAVAMVVGGPVVPSIGGAIDGALTSAAHVADGLPTLLSRDVIPNQGYQTPDGTWHGTFLGLEPKYAWLLRVVMVYAYMFALLWWCWRGYRLYVRHYRFADWTPRDDMVDRLRTHRWGQFGFVVVLLFVGMALFAPTVSPTPADQNIYHTSQYEVQYYDADSESVETIAVLDANLDTASRGAGTTNIGPWQYDQYDRFHPFGTMPNPGQDLFTFMAYGARISLAIGLIAIGVSVVLAGGFAMLTAYYKGLVDLSVVFVSDSIQSLPGILLLLLVVAVFQSHWLWEIYNGGLLLALAFGVVYWPGLWRAVRGPALQVAEQEWVDAAKSYGQRSMTTMRKHMLPYLLSYLLIYGSMSLGGVIIGIAGLSFLGLGIDPPTPEWGRAIDTGQDYVTTPAWHISLLPGILIVIVVTGFNALGDGIRDAMDPESEGEDASAGATATGGGA